MKRTRDFGSDITTECSGPSSKSGFTTYVIRQKNIDDDTEHVNRSYTTQSEAIKKIIKELQKDIRNNNLEDRNTFLKSIGMNPIDKIENMPMFYDYSKKDIVLDNCANIIQIIIQTNKLTYYKYNWSISKEKINMSEEEFEKKLINKMENKFSSNLLSGRNLFQILLEDDDNTDRIFDRKLMNYICERNDIIGNKIIQIKSWLEFGAIKVGPYIAIVRTLPIGITESKNTITFDSPQDLIKELRRLQIYNSMYYLTKPKQLYREKLNKLEKILTNLNHPLLSYDISYTVAKIFLGCIQLKIFKQNLSNDLEITIFSNNIQLSHNRWGGTSYRSNSIKAICDEVMYINDIVTPMCIIPDKYNPNFVMNDLIFLNLNYQVVNILQDKKNDPRINYNSLLIFACNCNNIEIMKLLLADDRVTPNIISVSLLKMVCEKYMNFPIGTISEQMMKLLLEDNRIDPGADDNFIIQFASGNSLDRIVQLLLSTSDKVNPGANNNNAIISAVKSTNYSKKNTIKTLLLDNRVDPTVNNSCILLLELKENPTDTFEILLQDKRLDPSINNNYILKYITEKWPDSFTKTNTIKLLSEDLRVKAITDNLAVDKFILLYEFIL